MSDILKERGSKMEPQDVRKGVDIYLTDTMELEPDSRMQKLNNIMKSLSRKNI